MAPPERDRYSQIPQEIEYVPHPSFHYEGAEERLFGEDAAVEVPPWVELTSAAEGTARLPARQKALSAADESLLFLRYNYARYRLSRLIAAQGRRGSAHRAQQMVCWFARAQKARADIVQANLALVLAMVARSCVRNVPFGDMVSEGNMALLRCVEKFDVSRGYKFSTYACRAILKSLNRLAARTERHRKRFPVEFDPALERSDRDEARHEQERQDSIERLHEVLAKNRARLTDIERTVVLERFAIQSRGKGRSLREVGKMIGLTNERVRQIQNVALKKIRLVLAGPSGGAGPTEGLARVPGE